MKHKPKPIFCSRKLNTRFAVKLKTIMPKNDLRSFIRSVNSLCELKVWFRLHIFFGYAQKKQLFFATTISMQFTIYTVAYERNRNSKK